jgi:hypothetical protein
MELLPLFLSPPAAKQGAMQILTPSQQLHSPSAIAVHPTPLSGISGGEKHRCTTGLLASGSGTPTWKSQPQIGQRASISTTQILQQQ